MTGLTEVVLLSSLAQYTGRDPDGFPPWKIKRGPMVVSIDTRTPVLSESRRAPRPLGPIWGRVGGRLLFLCGQLSTVPNVLRTPVSVPLFPPRKTFRH